MRWLSRLTTFVVGIAVFAAITLLLRAQIPETETGGAFYTWAKFRDGSKLAKSSPVVIAGVKIGTVTNLSIEGNFARVDLHLVDDIQIPYDSFVTRRADSLFGDSYIEIIPTAGDEGAQPTRLLKSGEPLIHVIEGTSTDSVLRAVATALPKINSSLELLHAYMLDGRKLINGSVAEGLTAADRALQARPVEGPLETARRAIGRVDQLTERGAEALAGTAPEVDRTLGRVNRAIAEARTRMADTRTAMVTGLREARTGMDQLDEPVRQATEIMAAIDNGEDYKGTLGRLVNDPALGDTLDDVATAGREAVSSFYRFKSWLGMRVELNVFSRLPRIYATAEISARTDKFYLVEFERGPLGGVPTDQLSDATGTTAYIRHQEIRDTLRFTAQFGKQLGPIAIRGGVKDSTFGFGVDALMMSGRLKISTDVFGSFDRAPRLKVAAAFAVFRSIYVLAGVDDALNEPRLPHDQQGHRPGGARSAQHGSLRT